MLKVEVAFYGQVLDAESARPLTLGLHQPFHLFKKSHTQTVIIVDRSN